MNSDDVTTCVTSERNHDSSHIMSLADAMAEAAAAKAEAAAAKAEAAAAVAEASAEKRKRQELEIPQSERLVLEYATSGDANSSEAEFSANIAQIANSYLAQSAVHEVLTSIGVTAEGLKRRTINFAYTCSRSNQSTSGFAYAWTDPPVDDVINIDISFLTRWKQAPIEEKRRIEMLIGWKVIHELAHLGFRWQHGASAQTPDKFGRESGDFVEAQFLGGLAGIVFGGEVNLWDDSKEVIALCITKGRCRSGGRLTTDVCEEYIQNAHAACMSDEPGLRRRLFALVDCVGSPSKISKSRHLLSSPATALPESSATETDSDDAEPGSDCPFVPYGRGTFRIIPCCGKRCLRPSRDPTLRDSDAAEPGGALRPA